MFPASTAAGGMCAATCPDVCQVPAPPAGPIPTPFPNMAQCAMAMSGTTTLKVKISNMPVIHKGTTITLSSGDEAGVAGGVMSGTFIQKVGYTMGSVLVKVEGQPAVTQLKPTQHNGASANAPVGMQAAPSQATVMIEG